MREAVVHRPLEERAHLLQVIKIIVDKRHGVKSNILAVDVGLPDQFVDPIHQLPHLLLNWDEESVGVGTCTDKNTHTQQRRKEKGGEGTTGIVALG